MAGKEYSIIYILGAKPDTWDYHLTYTCLINSGLTIVPVNQNLIENIGFDNEATHTKTIVLIQKYQILRDLINISHNSS